MSARTPPSPLPPSRTAATIAVAFLALDAVLLVIGGIATRRLALLGVAGVCALLAVGVVLLWRRYARVLADIAAQRQAMRREVESLRELLKQHSPHA